MRFKHAISWVGPIPRDPASLGLGLEVCIFNKCSTGCCDNDDDDDIGVMHGALAGACTEDAGSAGLHIQGLWLQSLC